MAVRDHPRQPPGSCAGSRARFGAGAPGACPPFVAGFPGIAWSPVKTMVLRRLIAARTFTVRLATCCSTATVLVTPSGTWPATKSFNCGPLPRYGTSISWTPLASAARSAPAGPGVYCVLGRDADEPVSVGETSSLPSRAAVHAAVPWSVPEPWLAYLPLPVGTPKHVLRDLESDLLGWHFWRTGRAPASQYSALPGTTAIGADAGE